MKLILEEVLEGQTRLVAELDERSRKVGRDLMADVPLASSALSRQHGIFMPCLTGWIYKDLGSTNGSWHNGTRLDPHRLIGLKEGDFLQLADVILKIRYRGEAISDVGSRMIIIRGEEFLMEHAFARMGYRLDFGGRTSQFVITGYEEDAPAVTFEMKQAKVFVTPNSSHVSVRLNNENIHSFTKLARGDSLIINEYEVLLVEGSLARAAIDPRPPVPPQTPHVDLTAVPETASSTLVPEKDSGTPQVFSASHTVAIPPERQKALRFGDFGSAADTEEESPPATSTQFRTFGAMPEPKSVLDFESMTETEKRLVFGIMFFLGASLFLFLMWLIFL